MGRPAITYDGVLTTLNKYFEWNYATIRPGCQDKISFAQFRKILMFEKVTTSERKVRELWKLMEDLDFFVKINQTESRFVDLAAVARALGFPVVDVKSSPKRTTPESDIREAEVCLAE